MNRNRKNTLASMSICLSLMCPLNGCVASSGRGHVTRHIDNVLVLYPTVGLEPERLSHTDVTLVRAALERDVPGHPDLAYLVVPTNCFSHSVTAVFVVLLPDTASERVQRGRCADVDLSADRGPTRIFHYLQVSAPTERNRKPTESAHWEEISISDKAILSDVNVAELVDDSWQRAASGGLRPKPPVVVSQSDDGIARVTIPRISFSLMFRCSGPKCEEIGEEPLIPGDLTSNPALDLSVRPVTGPAKSARPAPVRPAGQSER